MTVTWSDPRLARVPIRDCGEALVDVLASAPLHVANPETYLRHGVVERLVTAQSLLPRAVRLLIVDGYRPAAQRCQHPACALEEARLANPGLAVGDMARLTGECTAPPPVAPHPTGGAVDITLSHGHSVEARAGLAVSPTCCAGIVAPPSDRTRRLLTSALTAVGLVNYPPRWWHWSYGDRFWAFMTQAPHSRYGPL
jgi:D-alanyl-D-alanine dipeptidase